MQRHGSPLFVEVLPELATAVQDLLEKHALTDLAATVPRLRVEAIEGSGSIYFVSPDSIKRPPPNKHAAADGATWNYVYHSMRKRHWLGQVPRRRWSVVVEEIDEQLAVLTVDETAGALGEQLDSLRRTLGA